MVRYKDINGFIIASQMEEACIVSSTQDAVDLLGDLYFNNCSRIILNEKNIHPDFFRLHTGLAGDILQKFSNYNCKVSIIGDFSKYPSKSLQDFIRECNKGNRVFFVPDIDEAFNRLKK